MTPSPNDLTRQQLDELDALLQKMLAVPIAPSEPVSVPKAYVPEPPSSSNWRIDPPSPSVARQPHIAPTPAYAEPAYAGVVRPERETVVLETRVDPRSYLRMEPQPAPAAPSTTAGAPQRLFGPADPMSAPSEPAFMPPPVQQRSTYTEPSMNHQDHEEIEDSTITVEPPMLTFQPEMDLPFNPNDDTAAVPLTVVGEPTTVGAMSGVPGPLMPVYGVNRMVEFVLCLFGPPGEFFTQTAVKWALGLCGIGLLATAAAWTARGMGWMNW